MVNLLALFFGILFAVSLGFWIVGFLGKETTDAGNSTSTFWDVSRQNITIVSQVDEIKKDTYVAMISSHKYAPQIGRYDHVQNRLESLPGGFLEAGEEYGSK